MYKIGVLLAYQLLNVLYLGDENAAVDHTLTLYDWYMETADAFGETTAFYDVLVKIAERLDTGEKVSMRELNALRSPLTALLSDWMGKVKFKLYLPRQISNPVYTRKGISVAALTQNVKSVPNTGDDRIQVLLTADGKVDPKLVSKIDVVLTEPNLFNRLRFCYPLDIFDYDRIYLSGKLESLSSTRRNVTAVLGGSSYAMAGLKEGLMPHPAVNLAVNAQDPFYAFLSAETAISRCNKINTIVIVGGYYFWHTDMSDKPSGYYQSVLTRVNYPVLHSMHNYVGELLSPSLIGPPDPFMDKLFDLPLMNEKIIGNIAKRWVNIEYFNAEINPRRENGMLQFQFREQNDAVNEKAAQARAVAHKGNFNPEHLADNARVLSGFLSRHENVRLVVIVPPVTKFYRSFSAPELKTTVREMLETVQKDRAFTFFDWFDHPDFDVYDFQDYDHLNDQGATKLSKKVAEIIK